MHQSRLLADPDVQALVGDAVRRAVANERLRLARDLHDGLAQDLALIAAYLPHLAADLGAEHPVVLAARQALTLTRCSISDLAASDAPTAAQALELVADELAQRHGVHVSVHADESAVTGPARENLVRIAREAIVNASTHGRADEIDVSLAADHDEVVLRIEDNGTGLEPAGAPDGGRGFGMRTMRARAQALGGRLIAAPGERGGTKIEVVVP